MPAPVRTSEIGFWKLVDLTEIGDLRQLKTPLPSARPCPAGLFLVVFKLWLNNSDALKAFQGLAADVVCLELK